MPASQREKKKAPILHSRSYWQDFRRARAERQARKAARNEEYGHGPIDLHDVHPIYTFVPGRAEPFISVPLHNPPPGILYLGSGPPHAPLANLPSSSKNVQRIAQRAQARLNARPDADSALLARLANRELAQLKSAHCTCPAHRGPVPKVLVQTECVDSRDFIFEKA
ncbi:hypothetical protein B0H11DRAFT_2253907 [Mycena galericulata]|nr:hypothetical protein B0H11DRAFT_2253907 [Mycena galericulata]